MPIPNNNGLLVLSLLLFLIVYVFYTQKIYSYNNFTSFLLFSIIFPGVLILFNLPMSKEDFITIISFGSVFLIYCILLFLLKKSYNKLNSYFITKNLVTTEYTNKNFTFVVRSEDGTTKDHWDEKLAPKPSWLDYLITFLLFVLPIILIALIYILISAIFN
jgi:hypothetical protein